MSTTTMQAIHQDHEFPNNRARSNRKWSAYGMTLLEVMIGSSILVVACLGALHCQYYVAEHGHVAEAMITATNTAQLLLEDWKSTGGSLEYDPSKLSLGFSDALAIPTGFGVPEGLGAVLNDAVYSIDLNNISMLVMLKYLNVTGDNQAETTLRQLAVVVRFKAQGSQDRDTRLEEMPPVTLVTYVRRDGSNG